jgi:hypothetical protein
MEINEKIIQVVNRLRRIPDKHRDFLVDTARAFSEYRFQSDRLEALMEIGLPHRRKGQQHYFNHLDLITLGFYLRIPSRTNLLFRSWGGALKKLKGNREMVADLSIIPLLNNEDAQAEHEFNILKPEIGRLTLSGKSNLILYRADLNRPHLQFEFPAELTGIIEKVLELDFFMLPEGVRWDLDFVLETGMADCGGASKYCCELLKSEGYEARHCFGVVLAEPFASGRYFTEVRLDDQWIAIDPHFIKLLQNLGSLKNDDWPMRQSPGAVLLPMDEVIAYRFRYGTPVFRHLKVESYILNPICTIGDQEITVSMPVKMKFIECSNDDKKAAVS